MAYNSFPIIKENTIKSLPDRKGYSGIYGGRFVPETLMPALKELGDAFLHSKKDKVFQRKLAHIQRTYIGRPTPLYFARGLTEHLGGAKIYLKREDLAHTGAHKINNAVVETKGGVVALSGFVTGEKMKRRAVEVAKAQSGVKHVVDALVVKPAG